MASPSESEDLPYLDEWEIQAFFKSSSKHLNDCNLKYWGKGRNEVSTPLVQNTRPCAHISWNHAKNGHFIKYAIYFENVYSHTRRLYQSIRHIREVIDMYITRPTI